MITARIRRPLRMFVRLMVLVLAALAAAQYLGPASSRLLPSLSPFLAAASTLAGRALSAGTLLCLPLFVVSLWKRRWFCRNLCPTGFALECLGRVGSGRRDRYRPWPRFGYWLMAFVLGGAAVGLPLFALLDPLALFNGFWGLVRWPPGAETGLLGVSFLLLALLTLWRPNAWCLRCCPLGLTQELLAGLAERVRHLAGRSSVRDGAQREGAGGSRRAALFAIGGAVAALAARGVAASRRAIRPPGATDEGRMAGLCVRCGNCIRVCPEKIIKPDLGDTGLLGWMTPVLRFEPGYCHEACRECARVCPTGAIAPLTMDEKRQVVVGTAVLIKRECVGWEKSEHCMACQDYCPYEAVRSVVHNYVTCPEVDEKACRGCGACEVACPAERKAIVVKGLPRQRRAG
jgi:ferredoxin-type protein NapF